jgi:DNA replication and repair protein RecF
VRIRALKVSGLRNLAPAIIEPGPRFNVLSGDNGEGKTNLLEAIYVVGTLRSFRTSRLAELIRIGDEQALVSARVDRGGLERIYEVTLGLRSKKVRLDGKAVRPIARYFGDFNVVLFAPEDLQVPRGSPADRRRFLDRAVFQRQPAFLADSQAYDRILRTRNALLRDQQGRLRADAVELLSVYDEQLATRGARVVLARLAFLRELLPGVCSSFEAITRAGLEVQVGCELPAELSGATDSEGALAAALRESLASGRARDIARGATGAGPHRHDLAFRLCGQPAAAFASQGQLRALVLAWKTAELDLLSQTHGDPPVLLLDDVSSELDAARNSYLFDFLRSRDSQCFITTTAARHVLLAADRVDFEVRSGVVTRQK